MRTALHPPSAQLKQLNIAARTPTVRTKYVVEVVKTKCDGPPPTPPGSARFSAALISMTIECSQFGSVSPAHRSAADPRTSRLYAEEGGRYDTRLIRL